MLLYNQNSMIYNTAFYIISTMSKINKNKFKIGKHTGTYDELISRYRTYFIEPIVCLFIYDPNALNIETLLKKKLKGHFITCPNRNPSEWIYMDYKELVWHFNTMRDKFNNEVVNNEIVNNEVVNNEIVNNEVINNEIVNNEIVNNEIVNNDALIIDVDTDNMVINENNINVNRNNNVTNIIKKPFKRRLTCTKCNAFFYKSSSYNSHVNKKKITCDISKFKCPHCVTIFGSVYYLNKHIDIDHSDIINQNNINYTANKDIIKQVDNNNIKYTDNKDIIKQIDNNNICSIKTFDFSKDGIDLSVNEFDELFAMKDNNKHKKLNTDLIYSLICMVNLNPKKPEHHNFYIKNTKDGSGLVFQNNSFSIKSSSEIIEELISSKIADLQNLRNSKKCNQEVIELINYTIKNMSNEKYRRKMRNCLKPVICEFSKTVNNTHDIKKAKYNAKNILENQIIFKKQYAMFYLKDIHNFDKNNYDKLESHIMNVNDLSDLNNIIRTLSKVFLSDEQIISAILITDFNETTSINNIIIEV